VSRRFYDTVFLVDDWSLYLEYDSLPNPSYDVPLTDWRERMGSHGPALLDLTTEAARFDGDASYTRHPHGSLLIQLYSIIGNQRFVPERSDPSELTDTKVSHILHSVHCAHCPVFDTGGG
jgi:hypothetical protein